MPPKMGIPRHDPKIKKKGFLLIKHEISFENTQNLSKP